MSADAEPDASLPVSDFETNLLPDAPGEATDRESSTGLTESRRTRAARRVRTELHTWWHGDSVSRRVSIELVVFLTVYYAYRLGQGFVSNQYPQARANADWLIGVEQKLGLYFEFAWQQAMLPTGLMLEVFNWYYENMHFPGMLAALIWVFVRNFHDYRVIRNFWLIFTFSAFLLQWAWPLMPPRLMPELGFIDISSTRAGGIYSEDALGPLTNQIAAMPSVHFGWALLAAVTVMHVRRHWTSAFTLIHPAMTFVAIVVTANHWVLDAVVAIPMLALAYFIAVHPNTARLQARLPGRKVRSPDLPAFDARIVALFHRHTDTFRKVAWISLAIFAIGTLVSWNWFDVDEFANLQQAAWVQDNEATLYQDVASHHPPLYTVTVLALAWLLPGSALFWARMASMFMAWGAGLLVGHMFLRAGHAQMAKVFVLLWSVNLYVVLAGTRAMNEVPVLFLVTLAAWTFTHPTLPDRRAGLLTGFILAVSFLTRFTTVFFVPAFLLFQRRRLPWAVAAGIGSIALAIVGALVLKPGLLTEFWAQAVVYQGGRSQMGRFFTFGQVLLGSGLIVYAAIYRFVPSLRPRNSPWAAGAAVALGGLLLMGALPFIAPHYFLPFMPVLTAMAAVALVQKGVSRQGRQFVAATILATGLILSGIYLYATPHDNLEEAKLVGEWVLLNTPEGMDVLTDAPEYAILSERVNSGGYFWNQRFDVPADALNATMGEVSVVIASERIGTRQAFPVGFQDTLNTMPCHIIGATTIYWTGAAGESPVGDAPCPPPELASNLTNW